MCVIRTRLLYSGYKRVCNEGTKHHFRCIKFCQVWGEVLKTKAESVGYLHSWRDLTNVNALKRCV